MNLALGLFERLVKAFESIATSLKATARDNSWMYCDAEGCEILVDKPGTCHMCKL